MKSIIVSLINKMGYTIQRKNAPVANPFPDIAEKEFWEIYDQCKPYTMTSVERMYSLYSAVRYVIQNKIEGDFVECGVWRGGSSMMMAIMLEKYKIYDRKIYLFDTYEGMSEPTENDKNLQGTKADLLLNEGLRDKENSVIWCVADLNDVQTNLQKTKYPEANIVFVKGKVEDTLPSGKPSGKIALLRLDTDWYESTKHELNVLYPDLVQKGVLIIDDYGHWQGCRKAVDEYVQEHNLTLLMNRVDYTGRLAIKI